MLRASVNDAAPRIKVAPRVTIPASPPGTTLPPFGFRLRSLAAVFAACLGAAVPAQVPLDPAAPAPALDAAVEVLDRAPASLAEALSAPARRGSLIPEVPYRASVWSRIQVRSVADRDARWVFPLSVDRATVYVVGPGGALDTLRTGRDLALGDRDYRIAHPPAVALDLPAGAERTLIVHIEHNAGGYTVPMPVQPVPEADFLAERRHTGVLEGGFLGLLFALAAYNLFLLVTFRDPSYLFYVLFLAGSGLYWATAEGFLIEFVWPDTVPGMIELNFFGLALAASSYLLFTRSFLRTAVHAPSYHRMLLVLAGLWGLWAAGGLLAMAGAPLWPSVQLLAACTALVMLCTTVAAGIQAHRNGYEPARFYLLASASVVATGIAYTLAWLGWIAPNWGTAHAFQAGMAAEALLFAIALSYRIRLIDRQRAEAHDARLLVEATNAELRETNALRTDLLGFAAHDLRGPLTGIVGYAELLADEVPPHSDLHTFVGVIQKDAGRMLSLIDDLLVTAALQGKNVELARTPVDVADMVAEVAASYGPRAAAKDQSLHLDLGPGTAWASLDRARFAEVLDNIVSNAIKYTPVGGTVTLALAVDDAVHVTVSDTGPGFTDDDLDNMFGRFQRLSARPTGGETSTGLGLSIAQDLVILHGGEITVESDPGHGATFTVTVPVLRAADPVAHARAGQVPVASA